MIKDIRHIGIIVKNIDESLFFYTELFDFRVYKKKVESGEFIDSILKLKNTKVTTYKMKRDKFSGDIELLHYDFPGCKDSDRMINDVGIGHIALTVDDLEYEYERFTSRKISFLSKPVLSLEGKAKVAFCRAPEGTFIELVQVIDS